MNDTPPAASVSAPGVPSGKKIVAREWLGISVLLALLFGLDLLTFNISPTVWCDEVSFTEPAINYVMHGTYTSAVWQFQPLNTFPAVNCPLYTQSIIGWLSLFGTNLLAVRSYDYFLMGVSCLLFWLLLCRSGLVSSARWRLILVTVFHFGYGISYSYRCSRPDTLGLCLTLGLALMFTVHRAGARNFWLLVLSMALPWVSLTSGLFAGLACFFAVLVLGRPRFFQAMVVWAGLLLGVLLLVWFLSAHGALHNFMTGASYAVGEQYVYAGKMSALARIAHVIKLTVPAYFGDFSCVILVLGSTVLLVLQRRELKTIVNRRVILCSAAVFFATPLVFNITGHYAFYYSYTMFLAAMSLFAATAFPFLQTAAGILPALVVSATVVVTVLVGLPLRMAVSLSLAKITPRAEIQRQVDAAVAATDVVYTDDTAFFEVKQRAKIVYARWSFMDTVYTHIPGRHLTQADKDSVNKLVIRADQAEFFTNTFGGQWQAVAEPFGDVTRWERIEHIPVIGRKVKSYLDQPQTMRYPLQIFQRVTPETAGLQNNLK
ncbi:MAG TPA: hypothetical protein VG347_18970 [Verrucomicrobiae bacterium]|nr:hypothetical protein [Verrucomicrobiae bacterium]